MNRYKIEVKNKEQADEAQELFSQLGFSKYICSEDKYPKLVVTEIDYSCGAPICYNESSECEGLSFDQLRAIVSLHKNPINMDKVLSEVRSDALGVLGDKPMKEYLDKKPDGSYELIVSNGGCIDRDWIEIPEGAEICLDLSCDLHGFYKDNFNQVWCDTEWKNTLHNSTNLQLWKNMPVLWQRPTLPEELPFVDGKCYTNKSNGSFKLPKDKPCDISKWSELRGESLNDQYAEIEQVRQASIADTLNERQSTYGDFKDVANTTQYLLQMLSTDAMSDVQLEALHMICSKLARITHGDPNYKDNWHDIAGYATLVERSL